MKIMRKIWFTHLLTQFGHRPVLKPWSFPIFLQQIGKTRTAVLDHPMEFLGLDQEPLYTCMRKHVMPSVTDLQMHLCLTRGAAKGYANNSKHSYGDHPMESLGLDV